MHARGAPPSSPSLALMPPIAHQPHRPSRLPLPSSSQHAVAAKMALDGQPAPSVTGSKPMVIRYQKDTSTVPANLGMTGGKSMSR